MAHDPTSCDMIMYSTLVCFHPSKTCGNIAPNNYKSLVHAEGAPIIFLVISILISQIIIFITIPKLILH
jgi:hypothetical protein